MEKREFDIIVYGASGYTAYYVVSHLLKEGVTFAVAGRDELKIGDNLRTLGVLNIIECQPENATTFTSRTHVVLNCAGPYIFSGEQIVSACIETNTHYLDITGETYFIERIINLYSKRAVDANVAIINCCGFDSIPADLGVEYLTKSIGENCVIESVMKISGVTINHTSYDSLIYALNNAEKTRGLRRNNFKDDDVKVTESGTVKNRKNRGVERKVKPVKKVKPKKYYYDKTAKAWNVIFMGTDPSVVKKTQLYNLKNGFLNSEYSAYFEVGSTFKLVFLLMFFFIASFLTKFKCGVKLLLKYPGFFTFGAVKKNSNSVNNKKSCFKLVFVGTGVETGIKKKLEIKGVDPAYSTTAQCMVQGGIVLLDKIKNGVRFETGIITPGIAFKDTDLVERLTERDIVFVISDI